jgi:hypothetical protein
MALPDDCGSCIYWQRDGTLCRRYAPSPSTRAREVAHWPLTRKTDRCGVGSDSGGEEAQFVHCGHCIHWFQPENKPVPIAERRGVSPEWWEGSGFCTRYAPSPSPHRGQDTHWRVTHECDACGDGHQVD